MSADTQAVMTVLEAHVSTDQWPALRQMYAGSAGRLPPQMIRTFLVQSSADQTLWRGISIWRSREALEEYRRSVETPAGILMFRAAGAEPVLGLYDVVATLPSPLS